MATRETQEPATARPGDHATGAFSRLGAWTGSHLRAVLLIWLVVLAGFGVFAPKVESVLAGAGWQDSTSQSVQARQIIERDFAGLGSSALQVVVVDRGAPIASDPSARAVIARVEAMLRASKDVSAVVPPAPGSSVSANGRTAGVVVTGLSVAGAFGVARLIFQDGHLSGVLNFTPQGFVDAWGPLFFGAMVFGVAMDYTLFLLTAAKERYETHADPERSMVGSVRTSGRVVVSAAAVMIAVFLTFALSGPLAPKEMGVILAVAVALDALAVRLVLVPALLAITGHAAWYQPRWLGRVLPKVRFSH